MAVAHARHSGPGTAEKETILYMDLFSGISGDMCLGALVDLGVDPDWLTRQLQTVFSGFSIRTEIVFRHHLRAVSLWVDITDTRTSRTYTDIVRLIQNSPFSESVRQGSQAVFERIGRAEAHIHGTELSDVHFHEIGALDSLVDVIGTFLCLEYLNISKVYASRVPLGTGTISTAHGHLPVPVPATLAILKGIPVTGSDARTEIVTPTGAALVATLASEFGPLPAMTLTGTGYGAGKRDTGASVPNLLRLMIGIPRESGAGVRDQVLVINTQIDDMNPEILGFVMDRLLAAGALDVGYTPVQMKKNRPGTRMEVLCRPGDLDVLTRLILTETTAIGVRYYPCDRRCLPRESGLLATPWGEIRVKKVTDPEGRERILPEYEALRDVAQREGIPLKDVYEQVTATVKST